MTIRSQIKTIKDGLRQGSYISEAAVSQGILLPILHELGWPVFNTAVVIPEFTVESRRVDYALCHPANRPSVFIEVKKVGLSDGADKQLFEYAFHLGVPMAILTDGEEWSFYLPGEQGRYDERRVYKLNLLEREIDEAINRLERYLSYPAVCSGNALKSARADYQNVARDREIKGVLPKAWHTLLTEQDSLLVELLSDKVEDLCGYKPDLELCSKFLFSLAGKESLTHAAIEATNNSGGRNRAAKARENSQAKSKYSFKFKQKTYSASSARDVMTQLLQLLAHEDDSFLDRFASRKHGKKRRYIAQNREDLYPGRPDLAEEHSVEVLPGWWLGTNYSRSNIQQIIDLALEVAQPSIRSKIEANVL
ncbi:MAG: type I restriction enzyme HsdR N-terminal domain-containing protein [Anaerolineaceae bacterium]|nr:type I restriction enzyme HsdR N-terminal domain-containing protein [Anaerolineaceae bacterium]